MLIIALVMAAIGLAALVFAVVTSNALVAWVCIGASLLGVLLLIVDALRERRRRGAGAAAAPVAVEGTGESGAAGDSNEGSDDGGDVADVVVDTAETSEDFEVFEPAAVSGDEAVGEAVEEPAAHPAD